jgi:hypothetical protein
MSAAEAVARLLELERRLDVVLASRRAERPWNAPQGLSSLEQTGTD